MYCKNCGSEIADGVKFCPKCGIKISAQTPAGNSNQSNQNESYSANRSAGSGQQASAPQYSRAANAAAGRNTARRTAAAVAPSPARKRKAKKKKRTGLIVLAVVAAILIIFVSGSAVWFLNSSVRRISTELEDGDYEGAVKVYNRKVADSALQNLLAEKILDDYMDELIEDYSDGEYEYAEVYTAFIQLKELDNRDLSKKAEDSIETLSDVQSAQTIYEQAETLYEEGSYAEAIAQYEQISEDSPMYEEAQTRLTECRTKYKEDVLEKTQSPETAEEYQQGIALVEIALNTLGDDDELEQRKNDLSTNYHASIKETAMTEANNAISSGDYSTAISVLETAVDEFPDDAELSAMLESTSQSYEEAQISEILSSARTYINDKEYASAIRTLQNGLASYPDNADLSALLETAQAAQTQGGIDDIVSTAKEQIAAGEYEDAIAALSKGVSSYPDETSISDLLATAVSGYEDSISSQVSELLSTDNYDSALELLESAQNVLPDSTAIQTLYENTQNAKPVKLSDRSIAESENITLYGEADSALTDTVGNVYAPENLFRIRRGGYTGYMKIYLGREFSKLKFTLAICNEDSGYTKSKNVYIYGDSSGDTVLYSSGDIDRTFVPTMVELNVTNVEWLYIRCEGVSNGVSPLIVNPLLYR